LKLLEPGAYDRKKCTVFEIQRPNDLLHDNFTFKARSFDAANEVHALESEYVIVSCNVSGKPVFDYHSRVLPSIKESLQPKIKHWMTKSKDELPVNIMVLVLDSVSATDAFRQLPLTMKYLLEDLNFFQFPRYHALGEPTFLNAIPLLVGMPTVDFFKQKTWLERWDQTEFIWKHLGRSHYATAYMEDIPDSGTFNYGEQTGFLRPPTDFYPRSFFSAWKGLGGKSKVSSKRSKLPDMLKIFTKNRQTISYFLDFSENARELLIICKKASKYLNAVDTACINTGYN